MITFNGFLECLLYLLGRRAVDALGEAELSLHLVKVLVQQGAAFLSKQNKK
jgi:hypothetical protein